MRHGGGHPLRRPGRRQDDALPRPLPRDPRARRDGPAAHPRARGGVRCGCAWTQRQRFVVDNTNPTPADARRYVEPAREAGFRVVGYLVEVDRRRGARAQRGARRARGACRPRRASARRRRLLRPTPEEGFDELWHATAAPDGGWRIEPLLTTPPLVLADGDAQRAPRRSRAACRRSASRRRRAAFSWTCSGREAPTIAAATLSWRSTQASASWAIVRPASSAIGHSRSTASSDSGA